MFYVNVVIYKEKILHWVVIWHVLNMDYENEIIVTLIILNLYRERY